ncbi:sugar ABC transporter permease [Marinicrinis sediminis]|uniref:Sugar ABC transporter permease n=1 Tax=Marinicrinis sediminis TaxID=1652465 RepID=A0ABW5RA00_9BACL
MKKSPIKLAISYILLILIAVAVIYPTLWIVMSSLKTGNSLFMDSIVPNEVTTEHYASLFEESETRQLPYTQWYLNTLKIAISSMILGTLIQILTAYAISRFRFTGRKTIMTTVLVLGMFPGFMSMIAIFILLLQMNLLDTHLALIIVYAAGAALGMFVAKGFFDTLPKSLEEAARIDGASHFVTFWRVMLPLSKPIIVYVSLTTFMGAWVDFIFARLILRTRDKWTLAVGLYEMVNSYASTEFTTFAAGAVLAAIPVTLLFMFLQRLLVEGLTAGAQKG